MRGLYRASNATLIASGDIGAASSADGGRHLRDVDGWRVRRFPRTPRSPRRPRLPVHRLVHRRQAGLGAERDSHRRSRPGARHARLSSADRAEHDSRRAVRQPHQHEAAAGEGADLRRADGVRLPARTRAVHPADERAERRNRRGDHKRLCWKFTPSAPIGRPRPTRSRWRRRRSTRGYPRNFETAEQIARAMAQLVLYGLPDDYFDTFTSRIAEVTVDRARQMAATHLHPDRLATAIVSDSSIVLPQLAAAGLGEPTPLLPRL